MAVFDNLNLTTASGVAPSVVQYYERTLLQNARDELVHARDLQKRTLPRHNGKTVQFRRMTPFKPDTTPLQEGVTPTGQALAMSEITATIKPYGRHVELTDEMDWALLDNVHRETANELSFQALGTIDMVAANALNSGLNVIYVDAQNGVNTARSDITAADILTHAAIKRAVRTLEQNNAPKFADGYYHAIIDPETKYDLTSDSLFTDVAKYQDKSKVDKYELGTIYGVKFYMSNRAKTFPTGATLFGTTTNYALASGTAASKTATIAGATVSATAATVEQFCRTIAGMEVQIYDHSVTSYFPAVVSAPVRRHHNHAELPVAAARIGSTRPATRFTARAPARLTTRCTPPSSTAVIARAVSSLTETARTWRSSSSPTARPVALIPSTSGRPSLGRSRASARPYSRMPSSCGSSTA